MSDFCKADYARPLERRKTAFAWRQLHHLVLPWKIHGKPVCGIERQFDILKRFGQNAVAALRLPCVFLVSAPENRRLPPHKPIYAQPSRLRPELTKALCNRIQSLDRIGKASEMPPQSVSVYVPVPMPWLSTNACPNHMRMKLPPLAANVRMRERNLFSQVSRSSSVL